MIMKSDINIFFILYIQKELALMVLFAFIIYYNFFINYIIINIIINKYDFTIIIKQ